MSTKSDTQFHTQQVEQPTAPVKIPWYRSPWYNALILGLCNFLAPGIWNAMNSLGGGGDEEPYLVNAANALTFGLMVISCLFMSGPCVRYIGIKWTLILGTIGYAPYAAGLYTHPVCTRIIDMEIVGAGLSCLARPYVVCPRGCFGWPKRQLPYLIPSRSDRVGS